MEEFDDLVQAPDDSGLLDLSHRAWVTLDDAIWTWGTSLIVLNVSFNRIEALPPVWDSLHFSANLIYPTTISRSYPRHSEAACVYEKLKCNGNRLHTLPVEIQKCKLLEELYASENQMQILPLSSGETYRFEGASMPKQ